MRTIGTTNLRDEGPAALPLAAGPGGGTRPAAWAVRLAPTAAAVSALAAHRLLPDGQSSPPSQLYPGLLVVLLVAGLGFAALPGARGRLASWLRHRSPLFAGIIVWLATWDLMTLKLAWLPLPYFPDPDRVLMAMWEDRGDLAWSAFHSLKLLFSGYACGVAAGLVCGVLIGWFRPIRYWGMPLLKFVGPIPATAYVPLMMALFPSGFLSGSALIAVAVWFPVTMLTTSGMANVPVSYLDVARTLGAGAAT